MGEVVCMKLLVNFSFVFALLNSCGQVESLFDLEENDQSVAIIEETNKEEIPLTVILSSSDGKILKETIGGETNESGQLLEFKVRLSKAPPISEIKLLLSSSDETEGIVTPKSLKFTEENWMNDQVIGITGIKDEEDDGDQTYTITIKLAPLITGLNILLPPVSITMLNKNVASSSSGSDETQLDIVSLSPSGENLSIYDAPLSQGFNLSFSKPVDETTFTGYELSGTNCVGSFQVSYDDFSSCLELNSPTVSADKKSFALLPKKSFQYNKDYKIKLLASIASFDKTKEGEKVFLQEKIFSFSTKKLLFKAAGDNADGKLGLGESLNYVVRSYDFTLSLNIEGIKKVASHANFVFLLMEDKTVSSYGHNSSAGGLGHGDDQLGADCCNPRYVPEKIPGLDSVVDIAVGQGHVLFALNDGTVKAFGRNEYGQLGLGSNNPDKYPTPQLVSSLSNVIKVAVGEKHSLALSSDGKVFAWGHKGDGALCFGYNTNPNYTASPTEINISGVTSVKDIAAGDANSFFIADDDTVYGCGRNLEGQLGLGNNNHPISSPQQISTLSGVKKISASYLHTLALTHTGEVYSFGSGAWGALGHGTWDAKNAPQKITSLANVKQISAGYNLSFVLLDSGDLYAFGDNMTGALGFEDTDIDYQNSPKKVDSLSKIASVTAAYKTSFVLQRAEDPVELNSLSSFSCPDSIRTDHPLEGSLNSAQKVTGRLPYIEKKVLSSFDSCLYFAKKGESCSTACTLNMGGSCLEAGIDMIALDIGICASVVESFRAQENSLPIDSGNFKYDEDRSGCTYKDGVNELIINRSNYQDPTCEQVNTSRFRVCACQ